MRERDDAGYHPVNHTGTTHRRLISPDAVGPRPAEVLLGTKNKIAAYAPSDLAQFEQAVGPF